MMFFVVGAMMSELFWSKYDEPDVVDVFMADAEKAPLKIKGLSACGGRDKSLTLGFIWAATRSKKCPEIRECDGVFCPNTRVFEVKDAVLKEKEQSPRSIYESCVLASMLAIWSTDALPTLHMATFGAGNLGDTLVLLAKLFLTLGRSFHGKLCWSFIDHAYDTDLNELEAMSGQIRDFITCYAPKGLYVDLAFYHTSLQMLVHNTSGPIDLLLASDATWGHACRSAYDSCFVKGHLDHKLLLAHLLAEDYRSQLGLICADGANHLELGTWGRGGHVNDQSLLREYIVTDADCGEGGSPVDCYKAILKDQVSDACSARDADALGCMMEERVARRWCPLLEKKLESDVWKKGNGYCSMRLKSGTWLSLFDDGRVASKSAHLDCVHSHVRPA
jgi:hypothetical protein